MKALRYEVKMACDEMYLTEVEMWLRLHPEMFSEAYPSRRVNSLYFDSYDAECLNDNLIGHGRRTKLRLRWYGEDRSAVLGQLELKQKSTQLGWKDSSPLTHPIDLTTMDWDEIRQLLKQQANETIQPYLSQYEQPMLINGYTRQYYESADSKIRVTIDNDQVAYEQLFSNRPNLTIPSVEPSYAVIEIKADEQYATRISRMLPSFPIQVSRNSKYVNGVLNGLAFA